MPPAGIARPRRSSKRLENLTKYLAAIIWGAGLLLVLRGAKNADYIGPQLAKVVLLGFLIGGLAVLLSDAENFVRRRSVFVLATFSLTFTIFLLEVPALLGILDFRNVYAARSGDAMLSPHNTLDPILLHRRRPHLDLQGAQRGGDLCTIHGAPPWKTYHYSLQFDQNGFRNPPGMNSADIVVLGDSFIEAGAVSDEETLTSVLGRESRLTVANLGQSAYGPQQELEVLKRFAVGLDPKICVWTFFEGNDLSDMAVYPSRRAKHAQLARPGSVLKRRSFLWNTQEALKRALRAQDPNHEHTRRVGVCEAGAEPINYYFHYALRPIDTWTGHLEELEEILRSAYTECHERSIRFVVLFIPAKYRVYHDLCRFPEGSACAEWVVNAMPQRLEQIVSNTSPDVVFLDCTTALRAAAKNGEIVFFPDDTHWTALAQRIAAEVVLTGLNL